MANEFNLPKIEGKILKFWDKNRIFEKTLAERKGKRKFVFYEGPPYANGKPGIHHVLARVVKDVILRYKTMRGYYVPRRAGWDTHGLPVEMATEKALGLKSKKDIEKFGIAEFNKKAKEQVWIYKDEWEEMTRRIGYWLDLKNAYVTYEPEYIETLWWTIKQIANNKLLYKGHKVVPWCPRCGTALSSHELALGYKEITENSVYLKFRLKRGQRIASSSSSPQGEELIADENTYVLSWTTTPWTLPGNVALAVGEKIKYAVLKKMVNGRIERWIVAKEAVSGNANVFGSLADARCEILGKDLVGLSYEPLFDIPALNIKVSHKIYAANFVATSEGTGVVHTAVMYGEDDYRLGAKVGLPQHHTVDEEGRFTRDVKGFAGLYVKDKETENKIIEHLRRNGNLLKVEPYSHEYPFCWRCETPVLYYARSSWFIAMSRLKDKLLKNNKLINWVPAHLKEGRFGEWLKEVKDWNLSRERYWGTPLPIWECKKCGHYEVLGSIEELNVLAGGPKNNYWVMRHGESESQLLHIIDAGQKKLHLTPRGREQVNRAVKKLKSELAARGEKVDLIISSDVLRTKETAKIAATVLTGARVVVDKRIREINLGELEGSREEKYHGLFPTYESKFEKKPEKGESLRDLRGRLWELLGDLEKKHKNKNILLVSHEYPIWMLFHIASGWSEKRSIAEKEKRGKDFIETGELRKLDFKIVPRAETGEINLHRPYADEIVIVCPKCRGKARRVKEVADVWYDSGAMPFAQAHWPFGRGDKRQATSDKDLNGLDYPADYIAEGMDQTRGWFYTLLAIATALGYPAPYKNVVSLGLINDKNGQKMSKSKGNVVDPWEVINKYGVDAVRWYFYTVNPPGEAKNFDEAELQKAYRRMHLLLWNSLVFYKTYAKQGGRGNRKSANLLDRWILARLNQTAAAVTKDLDKYKIREAALDIEEFVDDLSRWYIRRSRRRFQKPVTNADLEAASATLEYVLCEIAKLTAPFTPFFAEALYTDLDGEKESVHLEDWPEVRQATRDKIQMTSLLEAMAEVRRLASLGLAKRAEAGIKVRQPLAKLSVKSQETRNKLSGELLAVLAEEVNVKEAVIDRKIKDEVLLDTEITPELREEGILREVVRVIQDLRQKAGLKPNDEIILMAELPGEIRRVLFKKENVLKAEVGAKSVEYKKSSKFNAEISTKLENQEIWLAVREIRV
jgi:isoleucyl-tRNA synthetase